MSNGPLRAHERGDAGQVGQVEGPDVHRRVAGALTDLSGDVVAGGGVADRQRDGSACACQRPSGLHTYARRSTGDDGGLAAQVNTGDDVGGGRFGTEGRCDGGSHVIAEHAALGRCSPSW